MPGKSIENPKIVKKVKVEHFFCLLIPSEIFQVKKYSLRNIEISFTCFSLSGKMPFSFYTYFLLFIKYFSISLQNEFIPSFRNKFTRYICKCSNNVYIYVIYLTEIMEMSLINYICIWNQRSYVLAIRSSETDN